MKSQLFKKGFTLIELLIVVAIIAILAAIAVPNFLEAQVRAKTARVKADMRSVGVALSSYFVDNNDYPPNIYSRSDRSEWVDDPVWGAPIDWRRGKTIDACCWRLTTPIAYLTSLVQTPFSDVPELDMDFRTTVNQAQWVTLRSPYWYGACKGLGGFAEMTTRRMADVNKAWPSSGMLTRNHGWYIFDCGPDKIHSVVLDDMSNARMPQPYDPTNGTVSFGDIYACGS